MGRADVDALADELTPAQLQEWQAFERLEPFHPERTEIMLAEVCAVLANINRRKGAPPFKRADFMPRLLHESNLEDMMRLEQGKPTKAASLVFSKLAAAATTGHKFNAKKTDKPI